MQLGQRAIQFGQIKTQLAVIESPSIPGLESYADLFSGALTLKTGNSNKMSDRKRGGKGESNLWGLWSA